MILFLRNTMPVGRYAGKNVKDIIDTDLQYMIWFRDQVRITLADETKDYINSCSVDNDIYPDTNLNQT